MVDEILGAATQLISVAGAAIALYVGLNKFRRARDAKKVKALRRLAAAADSWSSREYRDAVIGIIDAFSAAPHVVVQAERLLLDVDDLKSARGHERPSMLLVLRKQHRFVVHVAGRAANIDTVVAGVLASR